MTLCVLKVTITRYPVPDKPAITSPGINELQSSVEGDAYQWYCNSRPLPGSTRNVIVTRGGLYSVKVSRGDCISELSDPLEFKLTSPVLRILSSIYPNPAQRNLQ
jgi:hypothetical protein